MNELISDRELAKRFGYKGNRGGWRSVRDFLASRGIKPVDDRTPAMYHRSSAMNAYQTDPPRKGNFTRGLERRDAITKARETRAARNGQ